ncbi:unnamed protein product [Linum trigynum]|uniref:Uncharacterized protein n=1 Tax=Linum trigynum TaxID=586398 RepID=A0AAV2G560_9ROSI
MRRRNLIVSKGQTWEEGREVEDANGEQDEDEVGVDEASTCYTFYQSFLLDLDALLENDPFVVSLSKLRPHHHPSLLVDMMVVNP